MNVTSSLQCDESAASDLRAPCAHDAPTNETNDYCENAAAEQSPPAKRRSAQRGATTGNFRALKHGKRSLQLVTGKLPPGCSWVKRAADRFRFAIEAALLEVRGDAGLTVMDRLLLNTATKHERAGMMALRWLRIGGDTLPLAEKLALSKEICRASEQRDRCIRELAIDPSQQDAWSTLHNVLNAAVNESHQSGPESIIASESNVVVQEEGAKC